MQIKVKGQTRLVLLLGNNFSEWAKILYQNFVSRTNNPLGVKSGVQQHITSDPCPSRIKSSFIIIIAIIIGYH